MGVYWGLGHCAGVAGVFWLREGSSGGWGVGVLGFLGLGVLGFRVQGFWGCGVYGFWGLGLKVLGHGV